MLITEIIGDVFEQEAPAMAHGVNVDGKMGAGVAAGVRARYPEMYEIYREHCKKKRLRPGMVYPYKAASGLWVYNLATQDRPGRNSRVEWVAESVSKMAAHAQSHGLGSVATVRLGCGIGGLDWDDVLPVLESLDNDLELVVARPA